MDDVTSADLDALDDSEAAELLESLPEGFERALDASPPRRALVVVDGSRLSRGMLERTRTDARAELVRVDSRAIEVLDEREPDPEVLELREVLDEPDDEPDGDREVLDVDESNDREVLDALPDDAASLLVDVLESDGEGAELLDAGRRSLGALEDVRQVVETGTDAVQLGKDWRSTLRRLAAVLR